MSTPLTDSINALTTYANEVTGGSDTNLSDAVHTLASGYGGGGASSWTKVAETTYQVSTTSTSAVAVATWATGSSDLWTSSKWVYVRIRDTAGKREGYYYGGDQFFYNTVPINDTSSTFATSAISLYTCYSASRFIAAASNYASSYGVFADRLYKNGDLRIRARYSSSNTLTIDGTYKVEVYLLDPAGGVPIFE